MIEVKEQVLYDSRVRQQVENLRLFVDQKMSREEVLDTVSDRITRDELLVSLEEWENKINRKMLKNEVRNASTDQSLMMTGGNARRPLPRVHSKRGLKKIHNRKNLDDSEPLKDSGPTYGGGFNLQNMDYSPAPSVPSMLETRERGDDDVR